MSEGQWTKVLQESRIIKNRGREAWLFEIEISGRCWTPKRTKWYMFRTQWWSWQVYERMQRLLRRIMVWPIMISFGLSYWKRWLESVAATEDNICPKYNSAYSWPHPSSWQVHEQGNRGLHWYEFVFVRIIKVVNSHATIFVWLLISLLQRRI